VLTFVHVIAAAIAFDPEAAADQVTDFLVASVAALDVAASPGSPVWSFTYVAATANDVLPSVSKKASSA
jgi:hypothetical protein